MTENKIIIVAGPTATGKTAHSIKIATALLAEIVNFDSLLFYRELNIGTAKPTKQEQAGIPHHMLDIQSISEPLNAADYIKLAMPIIKNIHDRNKIPILVGGSGFYLQALLNGMYDSTTTSPEVLEKSHQLFETQGISPFLKELKLHDPESFSRYHENDHYRIRRACEHYWMTGEKFSQARKEQEQDSAIPLYQSLNWKLHFCYLDIAKDEHFKVIQKRTDEMVKNGLIQEVKELLAGQFTGVEKPLKSIGYKETIQYIAGQFTDITEYKERISISTRQLAKSQRTWFKKVDKKEYNSLTESNRIVEDCIQFAEGKN